jgi:hypothetical protein
MERRKDKNSIVTLAMVEIELRVENMCYYAMYKEEIHAMANEKWCKLAGGFVSFPLYCSAENCTQCHDTK